MPVRVTFLSLFALLLPGVFSLGCQATSSARLSGQASLQAGGQSSASANGSIKASGKANANLSIRLIKDRSNRDTLEYRGTISFAYNQAKLEGEETFRVLKDFQDFLQQYPRVKVRVEGRTDSRGSESYNKQLSRRRAEAIQQWLSQHGIEASRLDAVGVGEEKASESESAACLNKLPDDTAPCEDGWALSRRAVFSVTAGVESITKEEVPKATPTETHEDAPEPPPEGQRRWYLGGHVGLAHRSESSDDASSRDHLFLGPDIGLWLSPRWSLGLTGDITSGAPGTTQGRALLWLEAHTSSGPGPEFWIGAGAGAGAIPPQSGSSPSASFALRLGVDFHTSPATRLGPFFEFASRQEGSSWAGLGFRLAHDFF